LCGRQVDTGDAFGDWVLYLKARVKLEKEELIRGWVVQILHLVYWWVKEMMMKKRVWIDQAKSGGGSDVQRQREMVQI
jgi:hypothetical protein